MATIEIEKLSRENEYFRREVATAESSPVRARQTTLAPAGPRYEAAEGH